MNHTALEQTKGAFCGGDIAFGEVALNGSCEGADAGGVGFGGAGAAGFGNRVGMVGVCVWVCVDIGGDGSGGLLVVVGVEFGGRRYSSVREGGVDTRWDGEMGRVACCTELAEGGGAMGEGVDNGGATGGAFALVGVGHFVVGLLVGWLTFFRRRSGF